MNSVPAGAPWRIVSACRRRPCFVLEQIANANTEFVAFVEQDPAALHMTSR